MGHKLWSKEKLSLIAEIKSLNNHHKQCFDNNVQYWHIPQNGHDGREADNKLEVLTKAFSSYSKQFTASFLSV